MDIRTILDSFEDAILLVDKQKNIINYSNYAFRQLVFDSQDNFEDTSFNEIIIGVDLEDVFPGQEYCARINKKRKKSIPIKFLAKCPDQRYKNQLLIQINTSDNGVGNQIDLEKEKVPVMLDLFKDFDGQKIEKSLNRVLELAGETFSAKNVCVYHGAGDIPELKKLMELDSSTKFPKSLPSSDLISHSEICIWKPEIRSVTSLHRFARSNGLKYLATAPLGNKEALFGLLVISDPDNNLDDSLTDILQLFSISLSRSISHYIKNNNLYKTIDKYRKRLLFREGLFDNAQEGVVILDEQFKVIEINPAAEFMLEYANNEVYREPVENILIGADMLSSALEDAKNGISTHNVGIVQLHQRSGQSFPAHVQLLPIIDNNNLQGVIIIILDVSENEQIRIRTRQLEHRAFLGEFTSVFAHEVRNPINNISTGIQLLSGRMSQDDPNQEVAKRIQNDCVRLNHLMDSVLSFSKPIDSSKFSPVDIITLIQRVMDRWQPRFARVNVKPVFQHPDRPLLVKADIRSLERVFVNLISNAVNAMSANGGTLAVKVIIDDSIVNRPHVEITISDNGPGIPEEIRDRIFEPFVTSSPQGTGLGLAITKQIVTGHQGSISVNSFPAGTVFHIYLPVYSGG